MSWKETCRMDERERFVKRYEETGAMSALCHEFGISSKTGYKWLHRFEVEGAEGLADRGRAPLHCEHRMADAVLEALLEVRRRHPTWGPRKLLAWLEARKPK